GLTDLVGVGPPTEVGDDARTADRPSEEVRELLEHTEPLLASDTAAAADDDARGVQPSGRRSRLLAARDTDAEMLVVQRGREVVHRRRDPGRLRLGRVRRDREELRRCRETRLLEQAAAPALPCELQDITVDL